MNRYNRRLLRRSVATAQDAHLPADARGEILHNDSVLRAHGWSIPDRRAEINSFELYRNKQRLIALRMLANLEPTLRDLRYPPKRGEKRPPIPGPPPLPRRERACSMVTLGLKEKPLMS